jgi:hypothetical protein
LPGCANRTGKNASDVIRSSLDAIGTKTARERVKSLVTYADCVSPNGRYSTEIHTDRLGYAYFKQVYDYKPAAFEAVVESKSGGYLIGDSLKPLGKEDAFVIRGHEFHNIILEVGQRFHNFGVPEPVDEDGVEMYKLKVFDELNREGFLFFDMNTGLLSSVHFRNPDNINEVIRTRFSSWKKIQDLLLPLHVDIEQSGKKFSFDFSSIVINDPGFTYKILKK